MVIAGIVNARQRNIMIVRGVTPLENMGRAPLPSSLTGIPSLQRLEHNSFPRAGRQAEPRRRFKGRGRSTMPPGGQVPVISIQFTP